MGLSVLKANSRKAKFVELWKLLKSKDAMWVQRARLNWLKERDANTKYFHSCVKGRTRRNAIKAIKVNDVWVQNPREVKEVVVNHFRRHVAANLWDRPKLDGVEFLTISEEENAGLIAPFSLEEIERVVKESDGNKSPGPDSFKFAFF